MSIEEQLQTELDRGFSKSDLEKVIGLPQNFLSGFLKGKKKISKKGIIKVSNYFASGKADPLNIGFIGIIPMIKKRKQIFYEAAKAEDVNEYFANVGKEYQETVKEVVSSAIEKQIADIRSEKIPKERDTSLGRKIWHKEQSNRISQLQKQIK